MKHSGIAPLAVALGICAGIVATPAAAQSLEEQYAFYLSAACDKLDFERVQDESNALLPGQAGAQLDAYCSRPPPVAGPGGTTTATTGTASASGAGDEALRRRQAARRKGSGTQGDADNLVSGSDSVFVSLNLSREDQQARRFEGGRRADQLALTAGVDRRLGDAGLVGAAVGFEDQSADLDSGGTADQHGFSATLYGSWSPSNALFIDANGGATMRSARTSRTVSFLRTLPLESIDPARARSSTDQFEVRGALLAGADFTFGANSIGPRVALDYRRTHVDGHAESGTPMALVIDGQVEQSLRTGAGLQVSRVMNTASAVFVLQLNADWWHEYSDDQRYITARFAQDLRADPVRFRYQNQPPDRDSCSARLSLAATMPHGFSAFAAVDALLGYSYLDRIGLALGVRKEF
jgi:outer membrane autotransporter protein